VPDPLTGVLGIILYELVDYVNVVDNIEDQSLHFDEQQSISLGVKGSVGFELLSKVLLVVCELILADGLVAVLREFDVLRQAADLRGHFHDVQAT